MKNPNKYQLCMLIFLILINISLRYPIKPHEIGIDSYFIHNLASSINVHKQAIWTLNGLSYFGMFSMSYPSAVPFLISTISQLTSMNIEETALFFNIILGIVSALGAYMLAGLIYKNFIFRFCVSLLFSTSLGLLLFTTWTLSSRGLLLVLVPLVLWMFYKFNMHYIYSYLIALTLLMFLSFSAHRMFIVLIPFVILYGFIIRYTKLKYSIKNKIPVSYHHKIRWVIALTIVAIVLLIASLPGLGYFNQFYKIFLPTGTLSRSYIDWLFSNLLVYARNLGVIGIFALLGYFLLIVTKNKNDGAIYSLSVFILIAPMFIIETYMSTFSILFFCIIAGFGIVILLKYFKKHLKMILSMIIVLLVLSLSISSIYQKTTFGLRANGEVSPDADYFEESGYESALWTKEYTTGNLIGNDVVTRRITGLTGTHLFAGGPDIILNNLVNDNSGFIKYRSPFDPFFYRLGPIYNSELASIEYTVNSYSTAIHQFHYYDIYARNIINMYNLHYVVVNNVIEESSQRIFIRSVQESTYLIYINDKCSIYKI
jgi:hypothetical protein